MAATFFHQVVKAQLAHQHQFDLPPTLTSR